MVEWFYGGALCLIVVVLGCTALIVLRLFAREPHRFWGPFFAQSAGALTVIITARKLAYTYARLVAL